MKIPRSRTLACAAAVASLALGLATAASASAREAQAVSRDILQVAESKEAAEPLGVVLLNIHDFEGEAAQEARATLKLGERLQVFSVEERSIAARLGFQPGDVLMEINGIYVPKGKRASEDLAERVLAKIDWSKPVMATVLRQGFGLTLEMPSDESVANSQDNAERPSLVRM